VAALCSDPLREAHSVPTGLLDGFKEWAFEKGKEEEGVK